MSAIDPARPLPSVNVYASVALLQSANASVPVPTIVGCVTGSASKLPPTLRKIVTATLAPPLCPLPLNVNHRSRSAPPAGAPSNVNHAPWISDVPGAIRSGNVADGGGTVMVAVAPAKFFGVADTG